MTWLPMAGLCMALPVCAEAGTLVVTVEGVRSAAGQVLVAVCDRVTFLEPTCRYHGRSPAMAGAVAVRIEGIPEGVYAAQAYQDENSDGVINRNFFGIPLEGIGFSNNAAMRFGPPAFEDAAFQVGANGGQISFSLRYFN